MKKSAKREGNAPRLRFPEDERKYPWLSLLLEGLDIFDRGTAVAVQRAKRRQNLPVACRAGCGNCCRTNTDIPVYPLELAGIYWYCIEKLRGPIGETLKARLEGHTGRPPCPFLIDDNCSIYPVRPAACRVFIVFGRRCGPGEDAYFSRREDVLTPIEEFADRAFFAMLPFYGITGEEERRLAIKNKVMNARVQNLQSSDWKNLARKMEE